MSGFLTGRTSLTTVQTGNIAADAVTAAKLPDDVIDSEHYATGSIDPAHLADDAVTLAKMAAGTDGVIITYDASGNPAHVGPGSDGEVLTSTGAGSPPAFEAAAGGGFTLGTEQATTSGDAFTFGSIPAGTTMIIVSFLGCSVDANSLMEIELGDAGGIETSGYTSFSNRTQNGGSTSGDTGTGGFAVSGNGAASDWRGQMILVLEDASDFTWTQSHNVRVGTGLISSGGGSKSLSAELTQIRLTQQDATDYDAGAVNIMYI